MHDAIRTIRKQLQAHAKARAGTAIRYPQSVREAAVGLARSRRNAGISLRRTAGELGLNAPTLYLWLARKPSKALCPVAIADSVDTTTRRGPRCAILVTPEGYRIEGLEAAELVTLLRALA